MEVRGSDWKKLAMAQNPLLRDYRGILEEMMSEEETAKEPSKGFAEKAVDAWVRRIREDAIGEIVAPYFRHGLIAAAGTRQPLLAEHHRD